MASKASSLIAEIQAQYPGASVKANGRGRKHLDLALPDGRSVYVATIDDVHYRDGLDQWQEVDEALVDDTTGGFAKACTTTRHALRMGTGGTRRWYPRRNVATEYVDITEIQYYTNRWRTLNLPAVVWKQSDAEWDMANLYASVTNTWRQVKADFILKDNTAPTRLRFAVTLTGLTLGADWHLASTTDSVDVGSIDPPTAEDANGAVVPVTATYSGGYIEWQANTTGAVYPVTVDPTFTDGYGSTPDTAQDTYLNEANGATPYGTATAIFMLSNATQRRHSLWRFDLSSLDAGISISSATLSIYNSTTWVTARNYAVYAILSANGDWVEGATADDANWNQKRTLSLEAQRWAGDTGGDAGSDAGCSVSGTDYNATAMGTFQSNAGSAGTEHPISLNTTQVAAWLTANYGLIGLCTDASVYANEGWASSDHATTGIRPKLVIVYETGGGPAPAPIPRRLLLLGVGR